MVEKCIWGRGFLSDIVDFVEGFLRERGFRVRVVRSSRFYEYRLGFRGRITLVYYHSGNLFKICGSREIIEDLLEKLKHSKSLGLEETPIIHTGLGEYFDPLNKIYRLFDERDVLVKKCDLCKKALLPVLLASIVLIIIALLYGKSILEALPLAIFLLLILLVIPLKPRYTDLPHIQLVMCSRYKRKLEKITEEIERLLVYIPEKHPARDEIYARLKKD